MVWGPRAPNPYSRFHALRYASPIGAAGFQPRAPVAQGIERLPPEQKAAGSNPAGGTPKKSFYLCKQVIPGC